MIPTAVLFARTVHGKLYNLKTGEVAIVSFRSHMLDNPEFSVRFQNGLVKTAEMIRGGGPEVIRGKGQANVNGHTTTNGNGTISRPNGSSDVSVNVNTNSNAAVTSHQTWIKNPLVRKGKYDWDGSERSDSSLLKLLLQKVNEYSPPWLSSHGPIPWPRMNPAWAVTSSGDE